MKPLLIKKEKLTKDIHCRITELDEEMLKYLAKKEGVETSLVIRTAIQYLYEDYLDQRNEETKNHRSIKA